MPPRDILRAMRCFLSVLSATLAAASVAFEILAICCAISTDSASMSSTAHCVKAERPDATPSSVFDTACGHNEEKTLNDDAREQRL